MNTDEHGFMSKLTKVPSLKIVPDDEVAAMLRTLLKDADDGLRRMVKAGLYIEWIAANLPHGQLMPWIAANCPDVPRITIHRWRSLAKSLCEWSGLKFPNLGNLQVPADRFLTIPVSEIPEKLRGARMKMDEVLDSARTPKQLFLSLGFKQGELDAAGYMRSKLGRRKGEGGATKEQRARAQSVEAEYRIAALAAKAQEVAEWLMEVSDDRGLGVLRIQAPEVMAELHEAMDTARAYMRQAN